MRTWHGVPFASPPIGDLRWRAPRPVAAATTQGAADAAPSAAAATVVGEAAPGPAQVASPWQSAFPTSEDCLYLSVSTPDADGPRPVLLWLYGGGFENGAARTQDLGLLVREQNLVVVTPNYRVGALGFAQLAHHGGRFAEASNLGLQDVIAALAWVREHIARFGGDPDRVTVGGQSAGAFLAAALPAAPAASGLFHRLAMFSGGASRVLPATHAAALGDAFLSALGADPDAAVEAVLRAQRVVPAEDIGARNGPAPRAFGVVLDGVTVTEHPMDAARAAHDVPMLIGTTTREVAGLRGPGAFATGSLVPEVASWGVPAVRALSIAGHYEAGRSADNAREALLTDYIYRLPAMRLAAARPDDSTWACAFGPSPSLGDYAGHNAEAPLLFGTDAERASAAAGAGEARAGSLGRRFRSYLGAFVRDGDPGWPAVTGPVQVRGLLVEADELTTVSDLSSGILSTWEGVDRP
ncbi:carboxylesterase family protein [Cryptosporangium sp. NPDC048952]|uniref:carboxylesterase family protein n=1 Tax=Cryptosporangium sp. NPDC048952 TaxID=3363961 RepID=UPI00371ED050